MKKLIKGCEKDAKEALAENYRRVARIYDVYSTVGSGDNFCMQFNGFSSFIADSKIADVKSKFCQRGHCDTVFVAANFEEGNADDDNDGNNDDALMRFEFLEVIIRLAMKKYLEGGAKWDAEDLGRAIKRLLKECVEPNMGGEEGAQKRDVWRKERLYHESVDDAFAEHYYFLKAVFDYYKSPGHKLMKRMSIESFSDVMLHTYLVSNVGASLHDVEIAYVLSKMIAFDEIKSRYKWITLSFVDFIEAVARIAEIISFPAPEDLIAAGYDEEQPTYDYFKQGGNEPLVERRESSGEMNCVKTRPLAAKIKQVLEVMTQMLVKKYNKANPDALVRYLHTNSKQPVKKVKNFSAAVNAVMTTNRFSISKTLGALTGGGLGKLAGLAAAAAAGDAAGGAAAELPPAAPVKKGKNSGASAKKKGRKPM
eukprot:gene26993-33202_t